MTDEQLATKVHQLLEGEILSFLLQKITTDIALEIVESEEMSKREELYLLSKAVKRLDETLQGYANIYNRISEN